jgi:hypothetical protein
MLVFGSMPGVQPRGALDRWSAPAVQLLDRIATPRRALQFALAVAWLNFLGTVKWAHLDGALNGWKRPWYAFALATASIFALTSRAGRGRVGLGWLPAAAAAGGAVLLACAFLASFPPWSWWQLPFQDDWPPRFQVTIDGIDLLRRGALSGWQWAFLGGYHTSSNLSQSLAILAWLPVQVFGPRLGFHLLHAVLVAAIPILLYCDVRQEGSREFALLTAAFGCVTATGTFGTIMPSGDTNSIAGMVCVLVALVGSRASRLGRRWGPALLVLGLVSTLYSHAGFFFYAAVYLLLEACFHRDLRGAARAIASLFVATLVGLPLFWESLAYPGFTSANNVTFDPASIPTWFETLRKVYYNVEMVAQPHRWYNDYVSLSLVFLPVILVIAARTRSRAGFHAAAAAATIAMLWLNVPQFGYVFVRQIHMLAIFGPPVLAWFILEHSGSRPLAVALVAVVALYVQAAFSPIPHVKDIADFDRTLVERIRAADGNLVLIENNPHRSISLVSGRRSLRSRFGTHFEAYLPASTDRRFYGEEWDGWVWSKFRLQMFGGATFRGRAIGTVPIGEFCGELRRWGVRHAVVWSEPAADYFERSGAFTREWSSPPWTGFALLDADVREVVLPSGSGAVRNRDMLGADVDLEGAQAGDTAIVRTNFYPAWRASEEGRPVPLFQAGGQLAFKVPRSGRLRIHLEYPRRTSLLLAALGLLLVGTVAVTPLRGTALG